MDSSKNIFLINFSDVIRIFHQNVLIVLIIYVYFANLIASTVENHFANFVKKYLLNMKKMYVIYVFHHFTSNAWLAKIT